MKLVRDKIPELFSQHSYHRARPLEKLQLLRLKLIEEAVELATAGPGDSFLEELADVAEVLATLVEAHGYTVAEVSEARIAKAAKRGPFEEGWVLE